MFPLMLLEATAALRLAQQMGFLVDSGYFGYQEVLCDVQVAGKMLTTSPIKDSR